MIDRDRKPGRGRAQPIFAGKFFSLRPEARAAVTTFVRLAGVAAAGKVRRLASEVDSLGVDAMLEQPSCSGATDTVCRDAAAAAEGDVHGAWCTRCQQL